MRATCVFVFGVVILTPLARLHAADTDEKRACATAYERGQQLRNKGSLLASRSALLACAQDRCPDVVRVDCIKWLREVDDATPTFVVRARDPRGGDLADVRVFLDDVLLASRLDGKPLAADPGEHTLRAEHGDAPPIVQHLVVVMGEKNRIVEASFPDATRPMPTAPPSEGAQAVPKPASRVSLPTGILAGIGVVAAGASAYFEIAGISVRRRLFDTCAGHCSSSDVDFAYRELRAGDILGGVAVLAIAGAVWLYLAGAPEAPHAVQRVGTRSP
jgi:hypothetical protein